MYWVAYDKIGKLLEVSETEITNVAEGNFIINVEGEVPDLSKYVWDTGFLKFVPNPNERIHTKLQFMNRFTPQERISVRTLAKTDPLIDDFMQLLALAEEVNLDDQTTQAALNYLAYLGALTPQRVVEILA
jgi:hypothetical protein